MPNALLFPDLQRHANVTPVYSPLKEQGCQQGKDFKIVIDPTAFHNEAAWAKRLPIALQLCFPIK